MKPDTAKAIYQQAYFAAQLDAVRKLLLKCRYDRDKIEAIAAILDISVKEEDE